MGMGMLYDLQNKKVLSLRLKVWVLLVWQTMSGRVFQDLVFGSCNTEGSLAQFKSRSRQEEVLV